MKLNDFTDLSTNGCRQRRIQPSNLGRVTYLSIYVFFKYFCILVLIFTVHNSNIARGNVMISMTQPPILLYFKNTFVVLSNKILCHGTQFEILIVGNYAAGGVMMNFLPCVRGLKYLKRSEGKIDYLFNPSFTVSIKPFKT